jgi:hypothetical protein
MQSRPDTALREGDTGVEVGTGIGTGKETVGRGETAAGPAAPTGRSAGDGAGLRTDTGVGRRRDGGAQARDLAGEGVKVAEGNRSKSLQMYRVAICRQPLDISSLLGL